MDHPPMYGHYLRCMDETIQTSEILSIHQNSDVWLPRYAPMGADMGVFQVADAPTSGYIYTLPGKTRKLGDYCQQQMKSDFYVK